MSMVMISDVSCVMINGRFLKTVWSKGGIWRVWNLCAFWNDGWAHQISQTSNCKIPKSIYKVSHRYGFSCGLSNASFLCKLYHNRDDHICVFFSVLHLCLFRHSYLPFLFLILSLHSLLMKLHQRFLLQLSSWRWMYQNPCLALFSTFLLNL